MERHPLKCREKTSLAWRILTAAALGTVLALVPAALGQHLAVSHSGNLSGEHAGGFSGGGVHSGFSAPHSFRGFSGSAPRSFGAPPRMTWSASRNSFISRRGAYEGYRPSYYNAGNRRDATGNRPGWDRGGSGHRGNDRGNHRARYRSPYPGYGYGGYPSTYANSWELLPWDLGYPDFTDYGENEDNETAGPNDARIQPYPEEPQQPPPESQDRSEYAPATPYQPPANQVVASTPPRDEPKLTLIFKDGHTLAIRNYMLTPSEIIVMDDAALGREPRIPLAELNLPATEKAAQQGGLDFSPPST